MRLAVVGGSITGLAFALIAADHGHEVVVLERDPSEPPDTIDQAWDLWDRRVPQFRQLHGYQALARDVLREQMPRVLTALLAAGAYEVCIAESRDDLASVVQCQCRRAVLEWVLQKAAEDTPNVRVLRGVEVTRLIRGPDAPSGTPSIAGVETAQSGTHHTDFVIDASGRRSTLSTWLEDVGCATTPAASVPTGQVYYTRWYRALDEQPDHRPNVRVDLEFAACMIAPADAGWFSTTFFAPAGDNQLRAVLKDQATFHKAALAVPVVESWVDRGNARPESDVLFIGNLANQTRVVNRPVAASPAGIVAIGDAALTTNPTWGRGVGLGVWQACELARLLTTESRHDVASSFAELSAETLAAWYQDTVDLDTDVNAHWAGDTSHDGLSSRSAHPVEYHRVAAAARNDAEVFHRYVRYRNLRTLPADFWNDALVLQRARDLPYEPTGPTKAELLAAAVT